MEKIIEDVLVDLLQLLGIGVLSVIGYYVYHSATYKKLEKLVLIAEKKSPVLESLVEKVKTDAEKLLSSQEAKDATAQAIATVLQKKGLPVTEDNVKKVIDALESDQVEDAAVENAATPGSNAVQSPAQKA
ncbi:hypothetical protein NOM01_10925 [Sporolactobacillus sp. STSJ-5]|uniref:hypothetical protein n=1 Tax=Sporolactobacillus sp. STSJ-5 TaxID=2965076 RepID=UPI0021068851|nr:hypothetical protein [Sporolactobacillus sp. STSJ-5]MCQ2010528.1 hypothetical protein [Sporolactobacillus sp. STSJ-5]